MHAICKNNWLKYIIFINNFKMNPLELHIHMCFQVMHTWHYKMTYEKIYEFHIFKIMSRDFEICKGFLNF
jgi:hypothetical protein